MYKTHRRDRGRGTRIRAVQGWWPVWNRKKTSKTSCWERGKKLIRYDNRKANIVRIAADQHNVTRADQEPLPAERVVTSGTAEYRFARTSVAAAAAAAVAAAASRAPTMTTVRGSRTISFATRTCVREHNRRLTGPVRSPSSSSSSLHVRDGIFLYRVNSCRTQHTRPVDAADLFNGVRVRPSNNTAPRNRPVVVPPGTPSSRRTYPVGHDPTADGMNRSPSTARVTLFRAAGLFVTALAVAVAVASLLSRMPAAVADTVSANVLPDGEVEMRVSSGNVIAKQTSFASPETGYVVHVQQRSTLPHFMRYVYARLRCAVPRVLLAIF